MSFWTFVRLCEDFTSVKIAVIAVKKISIKIFYAISKYVNMLLA